jgi:hypothetical protein
VTAADGYQLDPGHAVTFGAQEQVYVITASGTADISWENE